MIVALGIVAEIWFSSRASGAEREIRDWYSLRVATLNFEAEQERLARMQIEARFADRVLLPEQISRITEKLRRFAGQEFHVTAYWNNQESVEFANQICAVLTEAGWILIPTQGKPSILDGLVGISVAWFTEEPNDIPAIELIITLQDEGFFVSPDNLSKHGESLPDIRKERISIKIGRKF